MINKTINGNLSGVQQTCEIMNGVFYDADLDTTKNHLALSGKYLTLSVSQTVEGSASSLLTLTQSGSGNITSNSTSRILYIAMNTANKALVGTGKTVTITVTATDESGSATSASFDVSITNAIPVVSMTASSLVGGLVVNATPFDATIVTTDADELKSGFSPSLVFTYDVDGTEYAATTYFTVGSKGSTTTSSGVNTQIKTFTPNSSIVSGRLICRHTDACGAVAESYLDLNTGSAPEITIDEDVEINDIDYPLVVEYTESQLTYDDANAKIYWLPFRIAGATTLKLKVSQTHAYGDSSKALAFRNFVIENASGLVSNITGITESTNYNLSTTDVLNGLVSFTLNQYWNGVVNVVLMVTDANGNTHSVSTKITIVATASSPKSL